MKQLETSLPYNVSSNELIQMEQVSKRIQVKFNGETIAESKHALLMLEVGRFPVYYFPVSDVRQDLLQKSNHQDYSKIKGKASYWHIKVGDRTSENAVWSYLDPLPEREDIRGYMAFFWNRVDAWFEEEEEIYGHARNPHKRIDYLDSTCHIQVIIGGEVVAETHRPIIVYESDMPEVYYIPKEDVRMDRFEPTEKTTKCPYKGESSYWSITVGNKKYHDIMWSYLHPLYVARKLSGLVSFYPHQVDVILIDGKPLQMINITDDAAVFINKELNEHGEKGIRLYFDGID